MDESKYAMIVDPAQIRVQWVGPDGGGPIGPVKDGYGDIIDQRSDDSDSDDD